MSVLRPRHFAVIAVGCLLFAAASPAADEPDSTDTTPPIKPFTGEIFKDLKRLEPVQPLLDERLQVVRQLMRARNWFGAASLLEELYVDEPENVQILEMLVTCYQELNSPGQLELFAAQLVQRAPTNPRYRLTFAEALIAMEKIDSGIVQYDTALTLYSAQGDMGYRLVLQSLIDHRQFTHALGVIDTLRTERNDSMLFLPEEGMVYERLSAYSQAATTYLKIAVTDTTAEAIRAERRLQSMLQFAESAPATEAALIENINLVNNRRTIAFLSGHYIRNGRFDEAFAFAVREDSLNPVAQGRPLVVYMRQVLEAEAFDQVIRMAERFDSLHGNTSRYQFEANRWQAKALGSLNLVDPARLVYERNLTGGIPHEAARAYNRIGDLYLDIDRDPATALAYYDSSLMRLPNGFTALEARRARPVALARMDRSEEARLAWQALAQEDLNEDVAEEVDYHLALLDFFGSDIDSAMAGFRRIMVNFPRGLYVNDCIRLLLVTEAAAAFPELMELYTEATFAEFARLDDTLQERLTRLADHDNRALAPVALYQLAVMAESNRQLDRVRELADRLATEFPDAYYVPYALKMKADLMRGSYEELQQARDLYLRLLDRFPNFPEATAVRQALREIEEQLAVG